MGIVEGKRAGVRVKRNLIILIVFPVLALTLTMCTDSLYQNNYIVYSASSNDTSVNLYLVDVNSKEKRQLTNTTYSNYPSWSSDGKKIVFTSDEGLYFINVDGTNLTKIIDTPNFETNPVWSPNHLKVAFISQNLGNQKLYNLMVVNIDGSNLITIANDLGEIDFYSSFSWSPNGQKLVFSYPANGSREIFTVNSDGSNLTQVTHLSTPPYSPPVQPSWSPDGEMIAFVTFDLQAIKSDGTGLTKLIDKEKIGSSALHAPKWSPDGTYIACQSLGGNVYLINLIDNQVKDLTGERTAGNFAWSPKGNQLAYFVVDGNGTLNIETINIDSFQNAQIVTGVGFYPWQSLSWQP